MAINNSFLGRGWAFPPAFDKGSKTVAMLEEELDIKNSLELLLTTRLGERIMIPKYGCALDDMLFEPLNTTLLTFFEDLINKAILRFEPRIKPENVDIDESQQLEGYVLIKIEYTIIATNSRSNLVFPYYKNEGTNI